MAWDAHARFMDGLVDDGFVLLGEPVGDGMRFLHIVDALSEREVKDRLAPGRSCSRRGTSARTRHTLSRNSLANPSVSQRIFWEA